MTAETGLPDKVVDALRRGNKVEAIKLLREQTGVGLKEAKDAVDASGIEGPAKTPGEVSRRGKIPWLILLVALGFLVYTFLRK
jgi:hypothetical protein